MGVLFFIRGGIIICNWTGTSSTRFIVFSNSGRTIASCQREHTQYYPAPGRVEHDPEELWQNTVAVIEGALSALPAGSPPLAAVGITNQRETTMVWNRCGYVRETAAGYSCFIS